MFFLNSSNSKSSKFTFLHCILKIVTFSVNKISTKVNSVVFDLKIRWLAMHISTPPPLFFQSFEISVTDLIDVITIILSKIRYF